MSIKRISDLPNLGTTYGKVLNDGHISEDQLSNCLMEVSYVSEGKVYQSFYESLDVVLPDLNPVDFVAKGLQPATESRLGGVKIGSNVCMNNDSSGVASILSAKHATTEIAGVLKLPKNSTEYQLQPSQFSNIEFLGIYNGELTAYNMPKISVDNPIDTNELKDQMFNIMYPQGAIYATASNVLPTSFRGIWRRCQPSMMLWNCDAISASNNVINAAAQANDRAFGRVLCQQEPTISCVSAGSHKHTMSGSATGSSTEQFCRRSSAGLGTSGAGNLGQSYVNISLNMQNVSMANAGSHAHTVSFNYDSGKNRRSGKNLMIRPESVGCSFWIRCADNLRSRIKNDLTLASGADQSQVNNDIDNAYQIWLVEPTHTETPRVQFYVYGRILTNNGTIASKIKLFGKILGEESSNDSRWDPYMESSYKDIYHVEDPSSSADNIEEPYN